MSITTDSSKLGEDAQLIVAERLTMDNSLASECLFLGSALPWKDLSREPSRKDLCDSSWRDLDRGADAKGSKVCSNRRMH